MSLPFDATVKEILAPRPEDFVPAFGLPRTLASVPWPFLLAYGYGQNSQ